MEKQPTFLIIGLGSMGKRRVRNLQFLGYTNLIGVEPKEERRKDVEKEYSIQTVASVEDGLKRNPDVFIISTPPDLHTPFMKKAVENGKPFFVEASVIDDGLEEIEKGAKKKGILAAPSATMRFKQSIRKIKELVDSGAIGNVLGFTYHMGQYLPDWHPWEKVSQFYVGKRATSATREMVCFETEWLTWILGPLEKISCMKGKVSDIDADIDDLYSLVYRFKNGVLGTVVIDVISRLPRRELHIMGSKGNLAWNWDSATVCVYDANTKKWSEYKEVEKVAQKGYWAKDDMYIEEMRHFVNAVLGKETYHYPLSEDRAILRVLTLAEESSDKGIHKKV